MGLALTISACSSAREQAAPAASTTASAPVATPAPVASEAAQPLPDDLDVEPLRRALHCAAGARGGACGVLAGFKACAAWDGALPSREGRWLGRSWTVDGGKTTEEVALVRVRRGNVGAGELPYQVGLEAMRRSDEGYAMAERAIRALERHDIVPKSNTIVDDLKKRTQWTEVSGTQTRGGELYVVTKGRGFLCRTATQNLFVVQQSSAHTADADGVYSELWAVSW
jgi:hypothetical protein